MALENVTYPQDQFGYLGKELYSYDEFDFKVEDKLATLDTKVLEQCSQNVNSWEVSPSLSELGSVTVVGPPARRKRRRSMREKKNEEEVERQRMTHIAVERNRRKLMNEYLSIMRSLMPPSYVQRGDQASIIGGAINFVKELEHQIHTLESQKTKTHDPVQFSGLFNYPQYTIGSGSFRGRTQSGHADIEVNVVESHANLKIFTKKRPAQLLKLVSGIQYLGLTVLHLNVTTVNQMVLYSLGVKIEEGSQLNTVDEVADVVNHLLGKIEGEAASGLTSSLN